MSDIDSQRYISSMPDDLLWKHVRDAVGTACDMETIPAGIARDGFRAAVVLRLEPYLAELSARARTEKHVCVCGRVSTHTKARSRGCLRCMEG